MTLQEILMWRCPHCKGSPPFSFLENKSMACDCVETDSDEKYEEEGVDKFKHPDDNTRSKLK